MKVQQAIEILTKYFEPEDELFITWWDRESAEDSSGAQITPEFWESIVDKLNDDEWFTSGITSTIQEIIQEGEVHD